MSEQVEGRGSGVILIDFKYGFMLSKHYESTEVASVVNPDFMCP